MSGIKTTGVGVQKQKQKHCRCLYLIYPDFQHDFIFSGINYIIFVLKKIFSLNLTSCGRWSWGWGWEWREECGGGGAGAGHEEPGGAGWSRPVGGTLRD